MTVGVILAALGVIVGPNRGVGDGPPTVRTGTFDGVSVGGFSLSTVAVAVTVTVAVSEGRAVGMICWRVAPHALTNSRTHAITTGIRYVLLMRRLWRWIEIIVVIYAEILNNGESYRPNNTDQIFH